MRNYTDFSNKIDSNKIFVLPIWYNEFQHYIENKINYFIIYELDSKRRYVIKNPDLLQDKDVYTLDIRSLLNIKKTRIYDINTYRYINNQRIIDVQDYYTNAHDVFYRKYRDLRHQNIVIPVVKWIELFDNIVNQIDFNNIDINQKEYIFYNDIVHTNLHTIESNGIHVDKQILNKFYKSNVWSLKDDLIYSRYNLYTSIGRPSNTFGKVNFAALPKENECRSMITSRYGENGCLVEFDYSAFHVKILGNIIGYEFKEKDIHTQFAKEYFGKQFITEEEYNESKGITFRKLYGGDRKYENDFFKQIRIFTSQLMSDYKKNGHITSILTGRKLYIDEADTQYKVLNYFIQLHEMEYVMTILNNLFLLMKDTIYNTTKLVLYTYDGLLFDCYKDESFQNRINAIENILSYGGIFTLKKKIGNNYNFK